MNMFSLSNNHLSCFILSLLISSCAPSPEKVFETIGEFDFSQYGGYEVCDTRESSIYVIDYEGDEYWLNYPLGSPDVIRFTRKYSDREIDSLSIKEGVGPFFEMLDTDTPLCKDFKKISDLYRSIWQTDSRDIFLQDLHVSTKHDVIMFLIWMPTDVIYQVVKTDRLETLLANYEDYVPNSPWDSEPPKTGSYIEIRPGLYYRECGTYSRR